MQRIKDTWNNVRWGWQHVPDLSGRVFIVTGGNSGVGYAAVKHLADHHAYVIMASRNQLRKGGRKEKKRASLSSVKAFAQEFKSLGLPLHVLICNAGVLVPEIEKTEDGMEIDIGNYFGHFYLAHLLLDVLKTSAPSRVVFMSSPEESRGFVPWEDLTGSKDPYKDHRAFDWYGAANLCKLMAAKEMDKRLKLLENLSPLPEVFVVQPGMTQTDLFRKMDFDKKESTSHDWLQWVGGQNIEYGAKSMVYAAVEPSLAGCGGNYYCPLYYLLDAFNLFNCAKCEPNNLIAKDPEARARLYDTTADTLEKYTGEPLPHRLPVRASKEM